MNAAESPIDLLPTSRWEWLELLSSLGVRPSKSLGQNFLIEHDVVNEIVRTAGVGAGDHIIEIGPGLGMLTAHLLAAGARVTAIELDRDLVPHLCSKFASYDRFAVIEGDALRMSLNDVVAETAQYGVVANLPYGIAAAVIMRFLELRHPPDKMTVMVQREVAHRIVASPPNMTVLGVAAQVLSEPELAFLVPPASFIPPPKVDSAVITLRPLGESLITVEERPAFFEIVNGGFRHKRKQILNSLTFEFDLLKDEIATRLRAAGIDPLRRAQSIEVEEWIALTRVWESAA